MTDWQQNFTPGMLNRGLEYVRDGRVKVKSRTKGNLEATVTGHDEYDVSIRFENGEIKSMFCTCPYFLRQGNCKHLPAALYSIEDEVDDVYSEVAQASPGQIEEFLIHALENDRGLLNDFRAFISREIDPGYYKEKLCEYVKSPYLVNKFIDEDLKVLIDNGEYGLLFSLSKTIIEYGEEISADGLYHASDVICERIDDIALQLIETDEAREFLRQIILNCEDGGILGLFEYTYSKIGDADELFE